MSIRLLIFLLFPTFLLGGQDVDSLQLKKIFKTYPLQFPREFILSYEQKIGTRYALEVGGSYYIREFSFWQVEGAWNYFLYRTNGFSVRGGLKIFFKPTTSPLGSYYNFVLLYKYIKGSSFIQEYDQSSKNENIIKNIIGLEYLIGKNKIIFHKILIGYYAGLGIRGRIQYDKINYHVRTDTTYYDNYKIKSTNLYPTVHFGINVGYIF